MPGASFRALATEFPATVRTNQYWLQNYPEMVQRAAAEGGPRVWTLPQGAGPFVSEMARYAGDPFRGTVERRVLGPDDTILDLEHAVAQKALLAAALAPSDVDILLVASFLGDHLGVGNAAFLAGALGMQGGAWNVEVACTGALAAYQLACGLVRDGQAKHVLVVTSCSYSRLTDDTDTLSWNVGDGAAAFVVGPVRSECGILGSKVVNTASTCGSLWYDAAAQSPGKGLFRMRSHAHAGKQIQEVSEACLHVCCDGALQTAGVTLADVQHFVFNTPTAWYMRFCARSLGVEAARSIDTYPLYGNVGPVLWPANLHAMAMEGRLRENDLVLLYSIGSVSSAGAVVVRWQGINV